MAIVQGQMTEPNYPCATEWKQAQPGMWVAPPKPQSFQSSKPSLSLPNKAALSPTSSV